MFANFTSAEWFFIALFLGLLLGWLVGWLVDWFFWRRLGNRLNRAIDTETSYTGTSYTETSYTENEWQDIQSQLAALTQERDEAQRQLSQNVQLHRSELAELREQLAAPQTFSTNALVSQWGDRTDNRVDNRVNNSVDRIAELEIQLNRERQFLVDTRQDMDRLQGEIEELQFERQQYLQENGTLQTDKRMLRQQLFQAQEALAQAISETSAVEQQGALKFTATRAELRQLESAYHDCQGKLASAEAELDGLQMDLETASVERAALINQLDALTLENHTLQARLNRQSEQLDLAELDMGLIQQKNTTIRTTYESQIAQLQALHQTLQTKLATLEQALEDAFEREKATLGATDETAQQNDTQLDSVQSALAGAIQARDEAIEKLAVRQSEYEELNGRFARHQIDSRKMRLEMDEYEERIVDLNNERDGLVIQLEDLQKSTQAVSTQTASTQAVPSAQAKENQNEWGIASLAPSIQEGKEQVGTWRNRLQAYQNQVTVTPNNADQIYANITQRVQALEELQVQLQGYDSQLAQLGASVKEGQNSEFDLLRTTTIESELQTQLEQLSSIEQDAQDWQTEISNAYNIALNWQTEFDTIQAEQQDLTQDITDQLEQIRTWQGSLEQTQSELTQIAPQLRDAQQGSASIGESQALLTQLLSMLRRTQTQIETTIQQTATLNQTLTLHLATSETEESDTQSDQATDEDNVTLIFIAEEEKKEEKDEDVTADKSTGADASEQSSQAKTTTTATKKTGKTDKDDLQEITGIGPTYEKRLNSSGIYTFADLAAMDPDDVRAIVSTRRQIDVDLWVDHARELINAS